MWFFLEGAKGASRMNTLDDMDEKNTHVVASLMTMKRPIAKLLDLTTLRSIGLWQPSKSMRGGKVWARSFFKLDIICAAKDCLGFKKKYVRPPIASLGFYDARIRTRKCTSFQ